MKQNTSVKGFLNRSGTVDDLPGWISEYPELHLQVKAIRESLGISQQKLADDVGLTWRSIPNIESGKVNPRISTLKKIAEQLQCDLKILLIPRAKTGSPTPASRENLPFSENGEEKKTPETEYAVEKKKEYFWD